MYLLVKFQLRILKSFEVTVLQSSRNRKIDLYSKYRENKSASKNSKAVKKGVSM